MIRFAELNAVPPAPQNSTELRYFARKFLHQQQYVAANNLSLRPFQVEFSFILLSFFGQGRDQVNIESRVVRQVSRSNTH